MHQVLTVVLNAAVDTTGFAKNVAAMLPGSDPVLKREVVVVSAHYDHIGTSEDAGRKAFTPPTAIDHIFNGANDDGSGTVSVIAIARALSRTHPKRTILFITFFGEELGLRGSAFYTAHPLFPLPWCKSSDRAGTDCSNNMDSVPSLQCLLQ